MQKDKVEELRKLIESYATICAGVAREECRPIEKSRPDYLGIIQAKVQIQAVIEGLLQPNSN